MASRSNLRAGKGLKSCATSVQLADKFTLDGRPVVLINTPGFDDSKECDTNILRLVAAFLAAT